MITAVVVRTLGFVIVRALLGLVGFGPTPDAKDVEIAVLRHQLVVPSTLNIANPPAHLPRKAYPTLLHQVQNSTLTFDCSPSPACIIYARSVLSRAPLRGVAPRSLRDP